MSLYDRDDGETRQWLVTLTWAFLIAMVMAGTPILVLALIIFLES